LAGAERINRVFFSSDRLRELGDDSPLTPFVGDYRIDISLDGQSWKKVADSSDRSPPSDRRKNARLLKLVTTSRRRIALAALSQEILRIDAQLAQIPPLPTWWVGTHKPAPGRFTCLWGRSPAARRRCRARQPAGAWFFEIGLCSACRQRRRHTAIGARTLDHGRRQSSHARVLANRVWHYHFARELSIPQRFRLHGSRPTHPELLDWLAGELLRDGWKLKPLHRLIMTSQAYRQSSAFRDERPRSMPTAGSVAISAAPLDGRGNSRFAAANRGQLEFRMKGPGFRLYDYLQDNVAT